MGMIVLCSGHFTLLAQTCCSGGVPVSANLGLPIVEKGIWQASISYDFNRLATLKSGRSVIADGSRARTTHSVLLEVGHAITGRLSADVLLSVVRQERKITQILGEDFTSSTGVGDATVLLKYLVHQSARTNMSIGLGLKAPIGSTNKKREDGILLSADLQPGSGAWDGILWLNGSIDGFWGQASTLFASFIHSSKGTNDSYLDTQEYRFGNEWQMLVGYGRQLVLGSTLLSPSVGFRYRKAKADQINGEILPSSGGDWIFVNPGLSYAINPNFSWQANMDIPLMADIVGTQVTPTYRINAGIYFIFK